MAIKYTYKDLIDLLNSLISSDVQTTSSTINSFLTKLLQSLQLITIVPDTATRNSIASINRYSGMLVYVNAEATTPLFVLDKNLTTWHPITLSGLTSTAITALLADKVDKVSGKALSQNDFTNALLTKLNGIEGGATKVDEITDIPNLREELDLLWFKKRIVTDSGITILTYEYKTIFVDASSGNIDLVLPATNDTNEVNTQLAIRRIDDSANIVILLPNDYDQSVSDSNNTELIEGLNSYDLEAGKGIILNNINDKWYIISDY